MSMRTARWWRRSIADARDATRPPCRSVPGTPTPEGGSTVTSSRIELPPSRVIAVDGLTVTFASEERTIEAVRNLSLHVDRGETLAIVGESGSRKSVTALALMRLVEQGGGRLEAGTHALTR